MTEALDMLTTEQHEVEIPNYESRLEVPDVLAGDEGEHQPVELIAGSKPSVDSETKTNTEDKGDKTFANPHARARILEKEKRESQNRLRDMEIELARMRQLLESKSAVQETEETEEEVDFSVDPLAATYKKIEKLEKKILKEREEDKRILSEMSKREALKEAERTIAQGFQRYPEVTQKAIEYLAKRTQRYMERAHPDLKTSEHLALAKKAFDENKAAWVSQGKNPHEELINLAIEEGFEFTESPKRPTSKVAATEEKPADIHAAKAKADTLSGLGGVPGAAPQKFSAKSLLATKDPLNSETEYLMKVRRLQEAGVLSKSRVSKAGLPPLSERLPGKGRQI